MKVKKSKHKRSKYSVLSIILIFILILEPCVSAFDNSELDNTAPEASLAVKRKKVVDLNVVTDYTGTKLTALKSQLDSLKQAALDNDVDFKYTLADGSQSVNIGSILKEGDPLGRGLSGNDSRTKESYVVKRVDNTQGYYGYFSAYLDTNNDVWASGSNYCVRTSHRPYPNPAPTQGWINYNTDYEVLPSSYASYAWVPTDQPYIYKAYYKGLGKEFKDVGTAYGTVITLETNGTVCYHGYYGPAPNEYGPSSPWYFGPATLAADIDKIWTVNDSILMLGKDGYLYGCGDARRGLLGRISSANWYDYIVYRFPWYPYKRKLDNLPKIKDVIISSSSGGFQYSTGPTIYAIDYNNNVWAWGLIDAECGLGVYPNEMAIMPGSTPWEPRNDVLTVPTIIPGLSGENIRSIVDGQIGVSFTWDAGYRYPTINSERGLKILKNDGTLWFFKNGVMRRVLVDYAIREYNGHWADYHHDDWVYDYEPMAIDVSKDIVALKDSGYAMNDGKVITIGRSSNYVYNVATVVDGIYKSVNGVWQYVPTPFNWLNPVQGANLDSVDITKLREGSDRIFMWVSDSSGNDYVQGYGKYFGLCNLSRSFANKLGSNKFAITAVAPESTFDYISGYDAQDITLRNFVNSSPVSGKLYGSGQAGRAINDLKDIYGVQSGVIKNNTNATVLVNEEAVGYELNYSDAENDPRLETQWKYTHDNTYYDNGNGKAPFSDIWMDGTLDKFTKVGRYTVCARARDNPKNDSRFDNYKLWSDVSDPAAIYVHRRPVALFSTTVASKVGNAVNLEYIDQSYDPDHNRSRGDKGIAGRSWQYKKSADSLWIDGKPYSLTYNTGIYEIKLQVKDIEGAWSTPYIDRVDTANLMPAIDATPESFDGFDGVDIIITASDNGENDFDYMRYAVTVGINQPEPSDWVKAADGVKTKQITINTEGTHYLHMEAYDTAGQRFYRMRGPYTIKILQASHFYITMMLDVGWRSYYFNLNRGIDDNHDGKADRYPRRTDTDIGTLKMPINFYTLVNHSRTYIKAGYKVKGKIDIAGNPDWAKFHINYVKEGMTCTDIVPLIYTGGSTYIFEWIIPLETDSKTFISFDLASGKGTETYGNERWIDTWDGRNTSRSVFYIKGKATEDLIFIQSQ